MLTIYGGEGDDIINWNNTLTQNGKIKAKLGGGNDYFAIAGYDSFRNKLPRSIEIDYGQGANQTLRISGTMAELKRLRLEVKTTGALGIKIKAIDMCDAHANPAWDKMARAANRWRIDGILIKHRDADINPPYNSPLVSMGSNYLIHSTSLVDMGFEGSTLIDC